jgi:N-acetylneuraminate synthase
MHILEVFRKNEANKFRRPYIIAEAGVNHEGKMDLAKRLVDEALEGGADAIKFQTYKAKTLAAKNSPAYWDISKEPTTSQFELFKKFDSFWKKEYEELKKYCDSAGIEFLSTPFDFESAKFLNDLMPAYKIASADITNKPFIEYIANFGKPILLSTGASFLEEIENALSWIPENIDVALLHCILNYPTKDENANLGMLCDLRDVFRKHVVGYSDHTLPGDLKILEMATLFGAQVIEKHFTYDKTLEGNDHYHAMDKEDLKNFNKILDRIESIYGNYEKSPIVSEELARQNARRSIVASRRIKCGEIIREEDLTFKRPAFGICPAEMNLIVGKKAGTDIDPDTILNWKMIGSEE